MIFNSSHFVVYGFDYKNHRIIKEIRMVNASYAWHKDQLKSVLKQRKIIRKHVVRQFKLRNSNIFPIVWVRLYNKCYHNNRKLLIKD